MVSTPNINELKDICGSDELTHCFKFLFSQQLTEDEGFLIRMGEECSQLRAKIEKSEQTVREAQSFGPFHEVATDATDCLVETLERERQRLQSLSAILAEAREGMREKERHVKLMEFDEDLGG